HIELFGEHEPGECASGEETSTVGIVAIRVEPFVLARAEQRPEARHVRHRGCPPHSAFDHVATLPSRPWWLTSVCHSEVSGVNGIRRQTSITSSVAGPPGPWCVRTVVLPSVPSRWAAVRSARWRAPVTRRWVSQSCQTLAITC